MISASTILSFPSRCRTTTQLTKRICCSASARTSCMAASKACGDPAAAAAATTTLVLLAQLHLGTAASPDATRRLTGKLRCRSRRALPWQRLWLARAAQRRAGRHGLVGCTAAAAVQEAATSRAISSAIVRARNARSANSGPGCSVDVPEAHAACAAHGVPHPLLSCDFMRINCSVLVHATTASCPWRMSVCRVCALVARASLACRRSSSSWQPLRAAKLPCTEGAGLGIY